MDFKLTLTVIFLFLFSSIKAQEEGTTLDIRECIDIALENNLTLRRSQLQREGARIDYNQSRAQRLPNANLSGGYGLNFGRSIDPTTNDFITREINTLNFGGNAGVVLFNGFNIHNTINRAETSLEASEFDVDKATNDITLNIINNYLTVLFNSELLENAKYQLESSKNQLERTKKLVASGALPRTNELELVSQVASDEVNLVNAQNNLDLAKLTLKQSMLIPASQKVNVVMPDLDITMEEADLSISVEQVYALALENQPEIRSADLKKESALLGVRVAQSGISPSITAGAGFRTNYSDAFSLGTETDVASQFENNLSEYLSLGIQIPIFNRLSVSSDIQRSKISLQQAELNAIEQRNTLRQTIESAYNNALAASKTYAASERRVEALEETFRSVENQYNLGAANFTDYQLASNNLYQAKSDLIRAKFDFVFKKKLVDFYQGKPLDL
ncbi:MAG: TolC family protein [Cyclobacteriaceae bacterium]